MRRYHLLITILTTLIVTPVYAQKNELYDTGIMDGRGVLVPGTKLIAGAPHKNEFFVLAPPEKARALTKEDRTPTVTPLHSLRAMKIAVNIKRAMTRKHVAIPQTLAIRAPSHNKAIAVKKLKHHKISSHQSKAHKLSSSKQLVGVKSISKSSKRIAKAV